ncbi:hemopexin-like [Polypterus senegalus]|nr:hemopexin-like [Polypterus senegalus]
MYKGTIAALSPCHSPALLTSMGALFWTLCLCLTLSLSFGDHSHPDVKHESSHDKDHKDHPEVPDRCKGVEFDAITLDNKGTMFFFKGNHLWKGFEGKVAFLNESFPEVNQDIDAAFRIHYKDKPETHDRTFIFKGSQVWSYHNLALEAGFPKLIQDEFPGIPDDLDAAVECPARECLTDSVIFFKDSHVYHYDLLTKAVKKRDWPNVGNCTSALRWLERYYCFHGFNFYRFHPVTGQSNFSEPLDSRDYFMKCPGRGHGNHSRRAMMDPCSNLPFDEFTSDDEGKTYAFRQNVFLRLDSKRDGWHAWPIKHNWKEVEGTPDAVFSWDHKMYFIQGDQIYIYKSEQHYNLVEGYPKSLESELGIQGPVDAAFNCPNSGVVHLIKGNTMFDVALLQTPRTVVKTWHLPFSHVDGAMCGSDGIKVFIGTKYHKYDSVMLLAMSRIQPIDHDIATELMGCSPKDPHKEHHA